MTSKMLVRDYLPQWLGSIKNRVRLKTVEDYESLFRLHVIPRIGNIRLNKLTPEDISGAWDDMLAKGKTASLVRHCHVRLVTALNDAARPPRALIMWNPGAVVIPPKWKQREMLPTDPSGMNIILEAAKDTPYYEALFTSFHTGVRRGELLGLKWKDIDLDLATLSVARSLYRGKGGVSYYQDTKTANGRRMVSLTPSNALALRALWERQQANGELMGYEVNEDSPVFSHSDGTPILPSSLSHYHIKLRRTLGLKGYTLHGARHGHATEMMKNGVHPKVVSERLGHANIRITLDTYSHVAPGIQESAAITFEKAMDEAREKKNSKAIREAEELVRN